MRASPEFRSVLLITPSDPSLVAVERLHTATAKSGDIGADHDRVPFMPFAEAKTVNPAGALLDRRTMLGAMAGIGGLALTGTALAQIAPRQLRLEALAVGIDSYANLRPLTRAVADARAMATSLGRIGYRADLAPDVGVDAMLDAFGAFQDRLGPDSAAFLYIAGHGLQVAGRNYILPADVPPLKDIDALSRAIPIDNWLSEIAAMGPAQTIVVLDACRNGGISSNIAGQSSGLASTSAPGGFFIAYSAASGEYALDALGEEDSSPNGLFARHLLEHLEPQRTIYEVVSSTRAQVIPAARAIGHSQHPAIYDQTSRPYRLDGLLGAAEARRVEGAGSLAGTGLVIAAAEDYRCLYRLATPRLDGERLARACEALGAEVELLLEPSKETLLEACRAHAARGFSRLGFFWMGMGGLVEGQACALLETSACSPTSAVPVRGAPAASEAATQTDKQFALVSHSDVVKAFAQGRAERAEAPATRGIAIGPARLETARSPMFLFFDACLDDLGFKEKTGDFARTASLKSIQDGQLPGVAVLAASSFYQSAADAADGKTSSPFTIALLNALGVPGLSIAQLAEKVRSEVETLTQRAQTPRLFAGEEMDGAVFVNID